MIEAIHQGFIHFTDSDVDSCGWNKYPAPAENSRNQQVQYGECRSADGNYGLDGQSHGMVL